VPGFNISVSPSTFSFNGNIAETRQITITATPTQNLTSAVAFGEVRLTENSNQAPEAHMTVAIKGEPFVVNAVSRKAHGTAGTHDVPLPLLGNIGVEPRLAAADGTHQVVVRFTAPVVLTGASVVEGNGTATAVTSGNDVIVNLANIANAQRIKVRLAGVTNGNTTADVDIPMGVLAGDTNGDGSVNSGDALQTRARSGQTLGATNFRSDVNTDGSINSGDTTVVRGRSGTSL
jgi:hypothetical protein